MSYSNYSYTKALLDIMFPPPVDDNYIYEDENAALADNRIHPEQRLEWETFDNSWPANFQYTNRQGKHSEWNVDLNKAVYFDFRSRYYMVIRGTRGTPVCFRLEDCRMGNAKTLICEVEGVVNFQQADPDCFPTEDTQEWMLKEQGF